MTIPIYNTQLWVGVGSDPAAAVLGLPRGLRAVASATVLEAGAFDGLTVDLGNGNAAVLILSPKCGSGLYAHEAVHVATLIIGTHGIGEDDEAMAYLVGYVTEKIDKAVTKAKAKERHERLHEKEAEAVG